VGNRNDADNSVDYDDATCTQNEWWTRNLV